MKGRKSDESSCAGEGRLVGLHLFYIFYNGLMRSDLFVTKIANSHPIDV